MLRILIPVLAIVGAFASGVEQTLESRAELSSRLSLFNTTQLSYLWGHNKVRATHAAPGLVWNDTLADRALAWANQCQLEHSGGNLLDGTPYGENLVAGTGNFPIEDAVKQFAQDRDLYDPSFPTYNHWTQVVWRDTRSLGCASAQCSGLFESKLGPASYYVCLYYPPGNVIGQISDNVKA
ncbi:SCP domain-containing protein [Mycena indigotica]|uniref:SCP domain-containing protein n=1 Tax=Mycena indigotica TaxID=2126181 RepID=A0A8H6W1X6_9AGAR|nr:SCP domain-containing protein [Mycena indigotica]KAF7301997.1 SCP domain-containing protein [Mycena indigotica]